MSGFSRIAARTVCSANWRMVLGSWTSITGLPPRALVWSNKALEMSKASPSKLVAITTSSPGLSPRTSVMATKAASSNLDMISL